MKKIISTSVLALAVLAGADVMAEPTYRGLSSEGTGNAKATLETGIVVEETGDGMDFGTITRFGANPTGTVTLSQSGVVTGNDVLKQTAGTPAAGVIKVSGAENTPVQTVTYTGAKLSNGNGKTIDLTVDGPATADLTTGETTLNVGGSFTLDGTEPDGEYSTKSTGGEAYTVTVAY